MDQQIEQLTKECHGKFKSLDYLPTYVEAPSQLFAFNIWIQKPGIFNKGIYRLGLLLGHRPEQKQVY
jgi:hypothetical protein